MGCGSSAPINIDEASCGSSTPANVDETGSGNSKPANVDETGSGNSKPAESVEGSGNNSKKGWKGISFGKSKQKVKDGTTNPSSEKSSPRPHPFSPTIAPNRIIKDDMRMTILVLGGPGSGKAALSKRLEEEFNMFHIDIGELLRAEVTNGTPVGKQIADLMTNGKLVPSEIALNILSNAKATASSKFKKIVIDGYPKNIEQAKIVEAQYPFDLILYLECTHDKLEERLLLRADNRSRSDDNTETIEKRLKHHAIEYMQMVEYFQGKYPLHMKKIKSGSLQKVEVFLEASTALKQMFGLEAKSAIHKKHDCTKTEYLFIMGGPGCGKGTQCNFLVKEYGYTHISSGDLLRNEVKLGTDVGKEVDQLMKEGKLVPLSITFGLLQNAFNKSKCKHFLVDGFPRSLEQAQEFENKFGKPTSVLYLSCSTATMERRIMERGKTSNRADDNPATMKLRFETFLKDSKPVIDHYKASGHLKEVSAEKTPEVVFEAIKQAL